MRFEGPKAKWWGITAKWELVQNRTLPGKCDLWPRPEEVLLYIQKTPPPSPGRAWSSPASVVSLCRVVLVP